MASSRVTFAFLPYHHLKRNEPKDVYCRCLNIPMMIIRCVDKSCFYTFWFKKGATFKITGAQM